MSEKPESAPVHVRLPEGVTYVSESLFEGCFSLETVYLPDSVRHIDRLAFARCYSLREIRLLLSHRLLTADAVEQALELANTGRHAEIMMSLLVYQREQFGTRKLDFPL